MLSSKKSLSLDRIVVFITVCTLFCILNPFFLWTSYRNGVFSSNGIPVLKILYVLDILLMLFYIFNNYLLKKKDFYVAFSIIIVGLIISCVCGLGSASISTTLILNICVLTLYVLLPNDLKVKIYKTFLSIFAISLIPGILFSIIGFLGVDFPFDLLLADSEIKTNNYVTYIHFPFAVQITKVYDILGNLNRFRLCGMFDEPGRVGTVCALFLTAEGYKLRGNWKNILIFIGGILSLSVAFFLILGLYYVINCIKGGNAKRLIPLVVLLFAFIIFLNWDFKNVALSSLQSRFSFVNGKLAADNRTNDEFVQFISGFFSDSSLGRLLFGFGNGATYSYMTSINNGYASSYLVFFYDYGVVGFLLILLWPVFFAFMEKSEIKAKNFFIAINILVYLINFYQRPTVFFPSYMIIMMGGIYSYRINRVGTKELTNE